MSEKPVAWMTPGGDVSRSLEWCKERCWPEGEQPTPLYSQSPAEARALAIAECARMVERWEATYDGAESDLSLLADDIRALSSPPSVSEEWVDKRIDEALSATGNLGLRAAVRATLAALGVTVEGAAK